MEVHPQWDADDQLTDEEVEEDEDDEPPLIIPPTNFSMVCKGVYRSGTFVYVIHRTRNTPLGIVIHFLYIFLE